MYTDPRFSYEFVALAGGAVEVEATAAIMALKGRAADVATATTAVLDSVLCPTGASIEAFGVEITEALTNANATKCIVTLRVLTKPGGTLSSPATLTLPAQASEVTIANSRASDGTPTTAQAVAAGARFISSDTDVPVLVPQGGLFYVEVTQAAGAAGGAFKAFVVIRKNGQPAPGPKADSPVTTLSV